jgi:hypothetical protein
VTPFASNLQTMCDSSDAEALKIADSKASSRAAPKDATQAFLGFAARRATGWNDARSACECLFTGLTKQFSWDHIFADFEFEIQQR